MSGYYPPSLTHVPLGDRGSVGDQNLVNKKNLYIDFYGIATGKCVSFKGFVTAFDDQYQANWNSEQIYGRMDPIMTYQNTSRRISLAWDVVAVSLEESISNLHRIEHLISMLYPVYSPGAQNTLEASPLMKIKYANFIRQADKRGDNPAAAVGGLISVVDGFNYAPNFEPGFFLPDQGQIYPKSVSINISFTVLHDHRLGWTHRSPKVGGAKWRADGGNLKGHGSKNTLMAYPYGADDLTGGYSTCHPEGNRVTPHKSKKKKGGKRTIPDKIANAAVGGALTAAMDTLSDIAELNIGKFEK